jgi:hypothetical protein
LSICRRRSTRAERKCRRYGDDQPRRWHARGNSLVMMAAGSQAYIKLATEIIERERRLRAA